MEDKCFACDPDSGNCCIWIDPLDDSWYLEQQTGEWNNYEDDWNYVRMYGIKYCPFCGKELKND